MQFQHPFYLILLGMIPVLIIWYQRSGKNNEATLRYSSNYFSKEILQSGKRKHHVLITIYLLILFLLIMGIARPRYVNNLKETTVSVIDMLLVLDISTSMLADDFKPNRLEAVKKTAGDFIEDRKEDRIGILVFAGESFIQCPLTIDKMVLSSLVKEITVASKEYDGTAIGMAIANATNRLRNSKSKSKVMILLSDGSNNAGELDPITAADLANQFDIKIYTIGAATDQSLTYVPGVGRMINEIDEKTLKEIAKETGGKYFRAKDQNMLSEIYAQIDRMERTEIEVKSFTKYKELFGWFLIPALIIGMSTETLNRTVFNKQT